MKSIKTLGILAVMALALAAFASSASAATFTAGQAGKAITESTLENHVFTVDESEVECTTIGFTGNTAGTAVEVQKVAPSYSGCTAGGLEAKVDTAGCVYALNANGTVTLESCTRGGITVTVDLGFFARCDIHVKNQTLAGSITWANDGASNITGTISENAIHAEVRTSDGLCPLTTGTYTNGSYTGKSTVGATGTTVQWDA